MVRDAYDLVSHAYRDDDDEDGVQVAWLEEAFSQLHPPADVLDLGCGIGVPSTQWFASQGHRVVGIDISQMQIQRAQVLVPQADFVCADMTAWPFPVEVFDVVTAMYSMIHVPVDDHPDLLVRIASALKPGGRFLGVVGWESWTGTEDDWLGVPGATMYWSHADRATYLEWFAEAGLAVESDRFVPDTLSDGGHMLVLARRSA